MRCLAAALVVALLLTPPVVKAITSPVGNVTDNLQNRFKGGMEVYEKHFGQGSGMEDHDLWKIRDMNKHSFHTFLNVIGVSPHVAIGTLKYISEDYLDNILFGKDEAKEKSPWSWSLFWLAPGLMSCRYMSYFMDTNFWMSLAFMASFVSLDLLYWSDLIGLFLPKTRGHAFITVIARPVNAVITALAYHYIIYPCTFSFLVKYMYYIWIYFLPFISIVYVFYRVKRLYYAFRAYQREISTIDHMALAAVERALRDENLGFVCQPWQELYDSIETLGEGHFGIVMKGNIKGNLDDLVAIKKIKIEDRNEDNVIRSVALTLAIGAVLGNAAECVEDASLALKSPRQQ
jgi:hypothetical protein